MDFTKLSGDKLFELYRAMHENQNHDLLQQSYIDDGIDKTILNLYSAISNHWYEKEKAKALRPGLGDEVWYIEYRYAKPEYGHVYNVLYDEDGDIITIDVIISGTNNMHMLYGHEIRDHLFRTKEEAQNYAKNQDQIQYLNQAHNPVPKSTP